MLNDALVQTAAVIERQLADVPEPLRDELEMLALRLRQAVRHLERSQPAATTNGHALTLTPAEAAELIGVSTRTLARMADTGELVPLRPTPRKPIYQREQIDRYLQKGIANA